GAAHNDQAEQRMILARDERGSEKHGEHGAIDRMPDQTIGPGANEVMVGFCLDGSAPVAAEVAAGNGREGKSTELHSEAERDEERQVGEPAAVEGRKPNEA